MSRQTALVVVALAIILGIFLVGALGEHRGWTTAQHQATIQYVLAILATLAGATAVWYAMETSQLRAQAQRQMDFFEQQARFGLIPFLTCSIYSPEDIQRFEEVPNDPRVVSDMMGSTSGRVRLQIQIFKETLLSEQKTWLNEQIRSRGNASSSEFEYSPYVVVVDNPTDKVAQRMWVVVYDAETQQYAMSSRFSDFLGPKEADLIEVDETGVTFEDLCQHSSKLSKDFTRWSPELRGAKQSFFAVLFLTFDGTACILKREFVRQEDSTLSNVASRLYW